MGINRNIVECKLVSVFNRVISTIVLIETLWNVNKKQESYCGMVISVLIETLWNVNILRHKSISMLVLY